MVSVCCWLRRGDLNLLLPSCGARRNLRASRSLDFFDRYANKRSLLRPPDAVACVAPGTRRSGVETLSETKNHRTPIGVLWLLVAERGFEPPDLRVMSPTSYLAALLRDIYLCPLLSAYALYHYNYMLSRLFYSYFYFFVHKKIFVIFSHFLFFFIFIFIKKYCIIHLL